MLLYLYWEKHAEVAYIAMLLFATHLGDLLANLLSHKPFTGHVHQSGYVSWRLLSYYYIV